MPSLRKRKYLNGKIVWMIDDNEYPTGRKRITIGECDKRTAEKIYYKYMSERQQEKFGIRVVNKIKLHQLKTKYLDYAKSVKSPRTIDRDINALNHFIEYFGNCFISNLNTRLVENYRISRMQKVRIETVNLEWRHLKTVFNWAVNHDYIDKNPLSGIKPLRVPESEIPRFFEVEEIKKVRALFATDPFKNLVEFYLLTGARLKEPLSLTWDNVDFRRKLIFIPSVYTKAKKHRIISFKNDEKLERILKSLPIREDNKLFGPLDGSPQWTDWWVSRHISLKLTKGKFPWATCHSFRHTFISHLTMQGVPLPTVKEIVGHSSIMTTLRYAHLAPSHKDEMIKKRPY
jgi:integrase